MLAALVFEAESPAELGAGWLARLADWRTLRASDLYTQGCEHLAFLCVPGV